MSNIMEHEPWIGTKEAALYASVSEKTIREWMDAGNLEYKSIGKRGIRKTRKSYIDACFDLQTEINEALSA